MQARRRALSEECQMKKLHSVSKNVSAVSRKSDKLHIRIDFLKGVWVCETFFGRWQTSRANE